MLRCNVILTGLTLVALCNQSPAHADLISYDSNMDLSEMALSQVGGTTGNIVFQPEMGPKASQTWGETPTVSPDTALTTHNSGFQPTVMPDLAQWLTSRMSSLGQSNHPSPSLADYNIPYSGGFVNRGDTKETANRDGVINTEGLASRLGW
jgi:hypothetical protein